MSKKSTPPPPCEAVSKGDARARIGHTLIKDGLPAILQLCLRNAFGLQQQETDPGPAVDGTEAGAMPVTRGLRLSTWTVGRLSVAEREAIFWDRDLPGFGVWVYPSGTKTFVVQSRGEGRSRRFTIGRHGAITAGEARERAARIIARIKSWDDPAPPARAGVTVAELAERHLEEHVAVRCKPGTQVLYRAAVRQYIVPAFGDTPVSAVRGRGDSPPRPHRLPEERDPRSSLGARGPRGGRAPPSRQKDRRPFHPDASRVRAGPFSA